MITIKSNSWKKIGNWPGTDKEKIKRFISSGHNWKTSEDGLVLIFAYESGMHNGPECIDCGYCKCWHCKPTPPKCKKPKKLKK